MTVILQIFIFTFAHAQSDLDRFLGEGDEEFGAAINILPDALDDFQGLLHDSKLLLESALQEAKAKPLRDRTGIYLNAINNVIRESESHSSEFLMGIVLRRSRQLYNVAQEASDSPKKKTFERRLLRDAIHWAIELYPVNYSILSRLETMSEEELSQYVRPVEYAFLGIDWARYVLGLTYSSPDNQSRMNILRLALRHWFWDIRNDATLNEQLAPFLAQIKAKVDSVSSDVPSTPIEQLYLARDIRQFFVNKMGLVEERLSEIATAYTRAGVMTREGSTWLSGSNLTILERIETNVESAGSGYAESYVTGSLSEYLAQTLQICSNTGSNVSDGKCFQSRLREWSLSADEGTSYVLKGMSDMCLDNPTWDDAKKCFSEIVLGLKKASTGDLNKYDFTFTACASISGWEMHGRCFNVIFSYYLNLEDVFAKTVASACHKATWKDQASCQMDMLVAASAHPPSPSTLNLVTASCTSESPFNCPGNIMKSVAQYGLSEDAHALINESCGTNNPTCTEKLLKNFSEARSN